MYLLLTIFSGGLFLIDIFFLALAAWFFYQAYKASKSGTYIGGNSDRPLQSSSQNMPIYQIKKFWLGVGVVVIWILSMFVRGGEI